MNVEEGRYLAARIPTATFVELPGDDHLPFAGNQEDILGANETFLAHSPMRSERDSVLATVLTVQSAAPAADRAHLQHVFAREVAAHRGRTVSIDDAMLIAAFDGPGRAVRCGCSVNAVAARSNISLRLGVHIGECDPLSSTGPVIALSAAIAAAAPPGEVLVSRTIVDLVPGSGLQFLERGTLRSSQQREVPVFAVAMS